MNTIVWLTSAVLTLVAIGAFWLIRARGVAERKSTSKLRDRFWIFALLCILAFVGITYVRTNFGGGKWWDEPSRDLALGFFPLGLSIVLWEYWLRALRHEEIVEYISEELTDKFSMKLLKLDTLESQGLIAIRKSISNNELGEFIDGAKYRLLILVPWFVDPTGLEPIFQKKANIDGFILKVILLHPASEFLKKRAEVVYTSPELGPSESRKTLLMLRNALQSARSKLVEVRIYDSLPSAFIVQCDDRALLGLHLNTGTALANPHFEIRVSSDETTTILGQMIEREIEKVSGDKFSQKIDLANIDNKGNLCGNKAITVRRRKAQASRADVS